MQRDNAGVELTITDVKVPIGMSARAREILDETNAKRGLVGGFGRVRGSNDLFRVEAKGNASSMVCPPLHPSSLGADPSCGYPSGHR